MPPPFESGFAVRSSRKTDLQRRKRSGLKWIASGLLLLLSARPLASARIGASLQECFQLYGYPVQRPEPDGPVLFTKYGLLILIEFFDGQACTVSVSKPAASEQEGVVPLSDKEVGAVMKANAFGRKWRLIPDVATGTLWMTVDGEIIAFRQMTDGALKIWTREALARQQGVL